MPNGPRALAIVCAAITAAVAAAVLVGWGTGTRGLIQIGPGFAPMQVNTALAFLAAAAALFVVSLGSGAMRSRLGGWTLAMTGSFIVTVAAATLLQYGLNLDLGIDQLLVEAYVSTRTSHPGRMSAWTAVGFLATGTVVLLAVSAPPPGSRRYAMMAVGIGFVGLLASAVLVVYLLELDPALGAVTSTRVAGHTATLFWLVAAGGGAVLSLGSPVARRAFHWLPVLLGIVVTLTVREGLIARDEVIRTAITQEWTDQVADHAMESLRHRVDRLHRIAVRASSGAYPTTEDWRLDAAYFSRDALDGLPVALVSRERDIVWSVPDSSSAAPLVGAFDQPVGWQAARAGATKRFPQITPPLLHRDGRYRSLLVAPVALASRDTAFLVAQLDLTAAMELDRMVEGYELGLDVGGVRVVEGPGAHDDTDGTAAFKFGGVTFAFRGAPTEARIASFASRLPGVVLATGLAFSVLLASIQFTAHAHARSEARFRALLESAPDAGIIVDEEGRIVDVNSRAETLFGEQPSDLTGRSIAEFAADSPLAKPVPAWRWNEPFDLSVPRRLGPDLPTEVIATPIQTRDGLLVSIALRDVTERKAMIARLRESDRLKSEFVSTVSHEMRTPLTVIREFSSLVVDEVAGPINDEQRHHLDTVVRNCDRLTGLIGDLLELARLESGKYRMDRRQTDLGPLLERCVDELQALASVKHHTLSLHIEGPLPQVLCDPDRVTQVVVNLVGNAHKFTPPGGSITVSAGAVDHTVEVSVTDSGVGIAPENHGKIFGAFVQIDREDGPGAQGTGLGLNVTRQIVEMHGGRMRLQSAVGLGSTFSFSLPLLDDELLTAFLAPHLRRKELSGTPVSLLMLREKEPSDSPFMEDLYTTIVGIQRLGRDEALFARTHGVLLVALEADGRGTTAFVHRLLTQIEHARDRLEYTVRSLASEGPAFAPRLDEVGDEDWLALPLTPTTEI